jgi:hypothetical protein
MQITFVRSGGATPILRAEGSVQFEDQIAHVTSGAYRRDLDSAEAQRLRNATDANSLKTLRQLAQQPSQLRDAFQYSITVRTEDGKTEQFVIHGEPPSPLVHWVQQEADQIWAYLHK